MTDEIDKLLRKQIEKTVIDVNSKFLEIKTNLYCYYQKELITFNFVKYMSTFKGLHSMNISEENVYISQDTVNSEENINTQDNNNRLDIVQITIKLVKIFYFIIQNVLLVKYLYVLKILICYRVF